MKRPVQPVGPLAIMAGRDRYMAPFMNARGGRVIPASGRVITEPNPINGLATGLDQVGRLMQARAKTDKAKATLAADQERARRVLTGAVDQDAALAKGGGPTVGAAHLASPGNPLGLSPQDLARANYLIDSGNPDKAMEVAFATREAPKGFTLGPGQIRYDASGNEIATAPTAPAKLTKEQQLADALGMPLSNYMTEYGGSGGTTVNVHPDKRVNAGNSELGKGLANEFLGLQKASSSAGDTLSRIRRAEQMLDGLSTGALAEGGQFFKRYGKYLGADLDALGITDDTAKAEAFKSLGMSFVMDVVALTKGAVSDAEMQKMEEATIGLSRTPEGNRLILDFAGRVAERQRGLAKLAREYAQNNPDKMLDIGWYEARDEYIDQNPLIDDDMQREIDALTGTDGADKVGDDASGALDLSSMSADDVTNYVGTLTDEELRQLPLETLRGLGAALEVPAAARKRARHGTRP